MKDLFDTIPDTLVSSLTPEELIRRLSIGTDREAKLAEVFQAVYTQGREDGEESMSDELDAAYDSGYDEAEAYYANQTEPATD
jgi:predicted component of type VI protein secretion system